MCFIQPSHGVVGFAYSSVGSLTILDLGSWVGMDNVGKRKAIKPEFGSSQCSTYFSIENCTARLFFRQCQHNPDKMYDIYESLDTQLQNAGNRRQY